MLHGADWVKADFHLHTKADKEFRYKEDLKTDFASEYIKHLQDAGIGVGVVTNHNKFDLGEYRQLAKKAAKQNILLLPGVELSVSDGSNGIHVLIAFSPETWLLTDENFIEQFLSAAFEGVKNRENENTRCKLSLTELVEKLDNHRKSGRDSFCIMAHVEQKSGFLEELDGGRIKEFGASAKFRESILGLQKVRTHERYKKFCSWWDNKVPANVEGSDCKCLAEIGKCGEQAGKELATYIKIGSASFSAVKFSLISPERISHTLPEPSQAYLKAVSFVGGLLDKKRLPLNRNLNCLVGIRGSGKSSILEAIRYGLAIEPGKKAKDLGYKNDLVKNVLGSGGKISIELVDKFGRDYTISRVLNENPRITLNGESVEHFDLAETILEAKYFGQKDLSEIGTQGFANDLVEKFFAESLKVKREQIDLLNEKIRELCSQIGSIDTSLENKEALSKEKSGLEQHAQVFKDKDIPNKLNRQISFKNSLTESSNLVTQIREYCSSVNQLTVKVADQVKKVSEKDFDIDKSLKAALTKALSSITLTLDKVSKAIAEITPEQQKLEAARTKIGDAMKGLEDEFALVRRECQLTKLDPDEFVKMQERLTEIGKRIAVLEESEKNRSSLTSQLKKALSNLNNEWNEEFQILNSQLEALNKEGLAITFKCEFKGDKDHFSSFLQDFFAGTGLNKNRLAEIVEHYPDTHQIYDDICKPSHGELANLVNNTDVRGKMSERIRGDLASFLSFRVSDKITLLYRGTPIAKHSLGQRATALVLFLLKCGRGSLLIIDQPEDDLDSQSIFEEIITELIRKKESCQFIFATHNPNVPVLGDCEQLIRCQGADDKIECLIGGIDNPEVQTEIVKIMEGGEDAFRRRKQIYQFWSC